MEDWGGGRDSSVIMQWEKKGDWKIWKNGGSKENYVLAKKVAKQRVFAENKKDEKEKLKDIETDTNIYLSYSKTNEARKMLGEIFIRDDNSVLAFNEEGKKNTRK